jgi:adenylosuccinate lyase
MATENLMMAAVAGGADRQEVHERIRAHSRAVSDALREGRGSQDLLGLLRADPLFTGVDFEAVLDPEAYIGRAPQQVDEFVAGFVEPIRRRYPEALGQQATLLR